ncbi:MAG: polyphosphate kinase 2 family protein [Planctomycetota bacterium]|nr:MAG: polyphosphate kinase 2 family protein [Planctomycetota bacterium]
MPCMHRFDEKKFWVDPKKPLRLDKRSTQPDDQLDSKADARAALAEDVTELREAQQKLYAGQRNSVLVILQGMDAAGKDGTIRHVLGGINPQGCRVYSFRAPNDAEVQHHFLCRPVPYLPARGMISVFNRSYYEEVFVVRVHPEFLQRQCIPDVDLSDPGSLRRLWKRRYEEIRHFERALTDNGTLVLKFFLHISPDEQKERMLERLTDPSKHWKFNPRDLDERRLWKDYRQAFQEGIRATSTTTAPWYIIPADRKWYARALIADILNSRIQKLRPEYPTASPEDIARFDEAIRRLNNEPRSLFE